MRDEDRPDGRSLPFLRPIAEDFLPILRGFARGRYAVSIAGSYGKGLQDASSDIDFRLFADELTAPMRDIWAAMRAPSQTWAGRGVRIDDVWPRTVAEVEAALAAWMEGKASPRPVVWSVWGYHFLPDIRGQMVLEDPDGLIAGWQERLRVYPPALGKSLLARHMGSLRYWRGDYHCRSKIRRGDAVFVSGLVSRLVHDMIQALCALNEAYYVGDGGNLEATAAFPRKPARFEERCREALYPAAAPGAAVNTAPGAAVNTAPDVEVLERQWRAVAELIDDLEALVGKDA